MLRQYDQHGEQDCRDTEPTQLMRLPGVGPTTATAILAMIGNSHEFKLICGRQFNRMAGLYLASTAPEAKGAP